MFANGRAAPAAAATKIEAFRPLHFCNSNHHHRPQPCREHRWIRAQSTPATPPVARMAARTPPAISWLPAGDARRATAVPSRPQSVSCRAGRSPPRGSPSRAARRKRMSARPTGTASAAMREACGRAKVSATGGKKVLEERLKTKYKETRANKPSKKLAKFLKIDYYL